MDTAKFISILLIMLSTGWTTHSQAAWGFKKAADGLCSTSTQFEYQSERYQLYLTENQNHTLDLRFVRKHRKYVPGISQIDAILVKYAKGKTIDLAKLHTFRIESNNISDTVYTVLDKESIEHLSKARTLSIEYTVNRTDEYAHDVELKYLAENIREVLNCKKKQTRTRQAKTDKWRFFRNSKALELGCHCEISSKRNQNTYRLIYIKPDNRFGLLFIDHNKADGDIDSINHLTVTDAKKRNYHLDVEGEFWELNGKEAFFVPLKQGQLKTILSGQKLAVNYASSSHASIEQTFLLHGIRSSVSNVHKCKK